MTVRGRRRVGHFPSPSLVGGLVRPGQIFQGIVIPKILLFHVVQRLAFRSRDGGVSWEKLAGFDGPWIADQGIPDEVGETRL